jgi:hypothetical protein
VRSFYEPHSWGQFSVDIPSFVTLVWTLYIKSWEHEESKKENSPKLTISKVREIGFFELCWKPPGFMQKVVVLPNVSLMLHFSNFALCEWKHSISELPRESSSFLCTSLESNPICSHDLIRQTLFKQKNVFKALARYIICEPKWTLG